MLLFSRQRSRRRPGWWPRVAQIELLETKELPAIGIAPAMDNPVGPHLRVDNVEPPDWDALLEDRRSAPKVPALSSLPNAAVSVYLDFDGDFRRYWAGYTNFVTPAFDFDGDPSSFTDLERDAIQTIWALVAEDYSPFRMNITTVKPSSFADGVAYRVVIGEGRWFQRAGGVTIVGSFTNDAPNIGFVFPQWLGSLKSIGEAASHEAGHAFGLEHQSLYDGQGIQLQEYYSGPAGSGTAPIMGDSYRATRGLWWRGTPIERPNAIQDDLSILSNNRNGFGYRADDHGDTRGSATSFAVAGNQLSAKGIITKTSDVDVFRIDSAAGSMTVNLVLPANNNLHGKIKLSNSSGQTLAEVDPPGVNNQFNATLTAQVAAGTYYVTVASHGGYADIGQYSLTGTFAAPIAAQTNFTARSNSPTSVTLAWTDRANNETGQTVQRSSNGGQSFVAIATLGANVTSYTDNTVTGAKSYQYRLNAFSSATTSPYSNVASVTTLPPPTPPLAPSGLSATAQSATSVRLAWVDNSNNETSFVIQRSLNNGSWVTLTTVGANTTSFTDRSLSARTSVRYRVQAINGVGNSGWSNISLVTTPRV